MSTDYQPAGLDDYVSELAAEVGHRHVLDEVEDFLDRFVAYPADWCRMAHVLWIAHTWLMEEWESTPRLAFLSPEPGSGKSRALEVTEPLVPRPVHAVNTTPAYLFRKVSDDDGAPTILYDEIDTVFGPKAKDNEDIRGMLNAGHRQGATAGRAVKLGNKIMTEELPAYCAVALAGLDDLPDTIMTRSIVVRMRRRRPGETVEPWRRRINGPEAARLAERLFTWSQAAQDRITWPDMPEGIEDRDADCWEALIAVADAAGGRWPELARSTAASAVAEKSAAGKESIGVMLLRDLRHIFDGADQLPTDVVLERLNNLDESPWGDIRGKELDARGLSRRLVKYGVKPAQYRDEKGKHRGYLAADLADPWERYLPPTDSVPDSAPAVPDDVQAPGAKEGALTCDVPAVPAVPDESGTGKGTSTDTQYVVKRDTPRGINSSSEHVHSPAPDLSGTSGTAGTSHSHEGAESGCRQCGSDGGAAGLGGLTQLCTGCEMKGAAS